MMSKKPRWPETLVNTKTSKPKQKTAGKQPAASTLHVSNGGKETGSSSSKTTATYGKSNSLSSRSSDPSASGSKAGGALKRGSPSNQGSIGRQGTRPASHPARPALRLSSSFSSLHTSSLTAAPFMRSSRSLNRLDQRSADSDAVARSQIKKGQTTAKKASSSGQLSSSEEHIRGNNDRECHDDNPEKMKASNKAKKQTKDGVYTLCAMTSGMRRNWVQAVLTNVRPSLTPDVSSSLPEQATQQKSPDLQSADGVEKAEHDKTSGCAEEAHRQQKEGEVKVQPDIEQSSADASSMSSSYLSCASSVLSPISPPKHVEEGAAETSSCLEGAGSDGSTCTAMLSNDEQSNTQQVKTTAQSESISSCECMDVKEKLICGQQTGQLVKELERTQKELSQLQQVNRNLQDELQQGQRVYHQSDHLPNSSSEQILALQRLQKMNHDLRLELEAQKRSHEEAREAELRRRVDLLAQQAQLLVTGDATALAQAHLEQDRRRFQDLQVEWDHVVASLKSQLRVSEEKRKEAESGVTQLQQELQNFHKLHEEADRLGKQLQEVTTDLRANEEAQTEKEARLQKHLMLLQASQDRERRSLTASLEQAEQHAHDLQERLDSAEEQVGSLSKTQNWTREIQKAQQQLQEELVCTVSAVQKLQEEREQLDRRCQELQNQLFEADGEVSRLQNRLKTDETHYYNLEHSYERVCEELQLALGKLQQKESATQDIREGYERLLDRKEQELSEVLLKMEVLGNSLEETEVKLNEVLKVCKCASSQLKEDSSETLNERQQTDLLTVNERQTAIHGRQLSNSSNADPNDSSYQDSVAAGDDPERFLSVIQVLESKLYVTEEKLRDIMQRLEEHQSHITCQDPHLCSQLTRSRATAQHLSLLLHSQAKQSQRFAQQTEHCCMMLVGRFQVALNIVQACRDRLQATPIHITDFETQLATVAACLQQGEKDAEKQKQESRYACKGEDKILNDGALAGAGSIVNGKVTDALTSGDTMESVETCLKKELFAVEQIVSALQSQHGGKQLSLVPREDKGDVVRKYKSIISQIIALKTERRTKSGGAESDNNEPLPRTIRRVCVEGELIYTALKLQQQYESKSQEHQSRDLEDINPPELAPYEEQVQEEDSSSDGAAEKVDADVKNAEAEKEPDWLEGLVSRLQRRAKGLRQLFQEISDGNGAEHSLDNWGNAPAADLNQMLEQAKWIYLSNRLHLDLEQELEQREKFQDQVQALSKDQDTTINNEQEAFKHTLCQLQEDNSVLREELERAEQKIITVVTGNQRLLEDIKKIEDYHKERMKHLEADFQERIKELQQIHEEEMKHLHGYYIKSCVPKEKQGKTTETTPSLQDQTVMERNTRDELEGQMREASQKHPETTQASCDDGSSALEEMHRKLIGDLQLQHQREVAALLKEKDQLLQEETAATLAAIVAMRRAHKQELAKSRQSQHIKENADVTQLHVEHEKEIQLLNKELEVLSFQHTQKCLENSRLIQELQDERRSLTQCHTENQELKNKQSETEEIFDFSPNGKQTHVAAQVNDFYEMEVILRAREAEMQFLRQEAHLLKEELKVARMDKIYVQNKLKALFAHSQEEPRHDVDKLCEENKFATWSPSRGASGQRQDDTSNSAFPKKTEKSSLTRQIRVMRSKSLKEGLSVQERMKLFEPF